MKLNEFIMFENRNGKHNYTELGHGSSICESVGECMEMEKRSRDRALSICQTYVCRTSRYNFVKQLNNLGKFDFLHLLIIYEMFKKYKWKI